MGKPGSRPIRSYVLATVLKLGQCTTAQVLAQVSRHISAAYAAQHGRSRATRTISGRSTNLIEQGRKRIVSNTLYRLRHDGKIRHVAHATYAPPLPRLFSEGEQAKSDS